MEKERTRLWEYERPGFPDQPYTWALKLLLMRRRFHLAEKDKCRDFILIQFPSGLMTPRRISLNWNNTLSEWQSATKTLYKWGLLHQTPVLQRWLCLPSHRPTDRLFRQSPWNSWIRELQDLSGKSRRQWPEIFWIKNGNRKQEETRAWGDRLPKSVGTNFRMSSLPKHLPRVVAMVETQFLFHLTNRHGEL